MKYLRISVLGVIAVLTFISCDNSTSGNSGPAFLGVWQWDTDDGDEYYISVGSNSITDYDYAGDEFDQGDDCYWIYEAPVTSVEGNVYTLEDEYLEENSESYTYTVSFDVSGDALTAIIDLSYVFDGETHAEKDTSSFTRSDKSVASFTPECQDAGELVNPSPGKVLIEKESLLLHD